MNSSRRRLIYSIELSILILGALIFATYYNVKRFTSMEQWIVHTHWVLMHTGTVRLYAAEAELQARNYMLTGEKRFIGEFERFQKQALEELGTIRMMTADNQQQQVLVDSATGHFFKSLEFSQKIIRIRQENGMQQAVHLIQIGEGKVYTRKASLFIRNLEHNENRLLRDRRAASNRALAIMNGSLLVTILFILMLIILLISRARKEMIARRKLFSELEGANRTLSLLFHRIDEVFFSKNMITMDMIQVSDTCERLFGYTAQEFLGNRDLWFNIIHPDDRYAVANESADLAGGTQVTSQYRIIRKDQEVRWVENKIIPTLSPQGNLVQIDGVTRDITQRKQDEEAIKSSEANLRTIFDHTDTSYVLINRELDIISFNRPAENYSEDQNKQPLIIGRSLLSYFAEPRKEMIRNILEKVEQGEIISYEYKLPQDDGSDKWFEVRWVGVIAHDHTHYGYILANNDITGKKLAVLEREQIITDLIHRNKALEQFTYIVSHNLRSPVANISGLGDALKMLSEDAPERAGLVQDIISSVDILDHMIIDLNNILQVREKVNEKKQQVDLQQLVMEVKNSIGAISNEKRVKVTCTFESPGQVYTIRSYLYSVFYNLLLNSVKYSQPGLLPEIHISSCLMPGHIQLKLKDNGKGIDLEKHGANVFGLYRRFDLSVEGKGVGLFMVKTQVEGLGGTISIASEPGKGTEFTITLPITDDVKR